MEYIVGNIETGAYIYKFFYTEAEAKACAAAEDWYYYTMEQWKNPELVAKVPHIEQALHNNVNAKGKPLTEKQKIKYQEFIRKYKTAPKPQVQTQKYWHEHDSDGDDMGYWQSGGYNEK